MVHGLGVERLPLYAPRGVLALLETLVGSRGITPVVQPKMVGDRRWCASVACGSSSPAPTTPSRPSRCGSSPTTARHRPSSTRPTPAPAGPSRPLGEGIGIAVVEATFLARRVGECNAVHRTAAFTGADTAAAGVAQLVITHIPPDRRPRGPPGRGRPCVGGPVHVARPHERYAPHMSTASTTAASPTSCVPSPSSATSPRWPTARCWCRFGRHPGAVHRVGRRGRAPVDAGHGQGLGHRRVLDAARARRPSASAARRATGKPSGRTQEIQRLIGRSLRAVCRHGGARRAPDPRRLRRPPGRRRHPHRVDLRRLRGAARRLHPPRRSRRARRATRCTDAVRRHLRRHRRRRAAARPALRRGLARRGRHERGDDRRRAASSRCRAPPRAWPFSRGELDSLLDLAEAGIGEIIELQREVVADPPSPARP